MRRASASPLVRALSLAFSICSRKVRAFRASSSRCRHSRSASPWAFSSRWRFSSSWVSTSSNRTDSLSICALAFSMTLSSSPSRREMAKALDLPGIPISSR